MRAAYGRFIFQNLIYSQSKCFHLQNSKKTRSDNKKSKRSTSQDESIKKPEPGTKVLVTHCEVPDEGLEMLRANCEVIICESMPPDRSEILDKCKGVHGLYWAVKEKLNAEILDAVGPQLKSISTMSAGIDHVDVAELQKRQLPLGHTPYVLTNAVADAAIGLMVAAGRRFHEGRQKIATCTWVTYRHKWLLGKDIRGSIVGFYGFGNIGQAIAQRLHGFEIDRVLYTTRNRLCNEIEKNLNAKFTTFDEMLALSDFVFIVAPLTMETEGVFNVNAFGKMKDSAVLINIARGGIVNLDDLHDALKCNKIFAAGLDVMEPEPLPPDHKLLTLDNCILTPHIGSATLRSRIDMSLIAAQNVLRGLVGAPMLAPAY